MNIFMKLWIAIRWYKKRRQYGYKFLDGDPAYDFLKTKEFKGFILLGAKITRAKIKTSMNPGATIELGLLHTKEKIIQPLPYNYNRTLRHVKRLLKYGKEIADKQS